MSYGGSECFGEAGVSPGHIHGGPLKPKSRWEQRVDMKWDQLIVKPSPAPG